MKFLVADINKIPEAQRAGARKIEAEGEYKGMFEVDAGPLLDNHQAILGEKKDLQKKYDTLKPFEAFATSGKTVDELTAAEKFYVENKDKVLSKEKEAAIEQRLRPEIEKEFKGKLDEASAATQGMERSLREHLIRGEAIRAIEQQEGNVDVLVDHVMKHIDVFVLDVEDGKGGTIKKHVAKVIDRETKKPRYSGEGDGKEMTVSQLVEKEFKANKSFAPNFKGSGASGTGKPPGARNTNRSSETTLTELSKLNPVERLQRARNL